MDQAVKFTTFLSEQESPWIIIITVIIAIPFLVKLLKEISTISHTIEIKNIEAFSANINKESTPASKYKLEKFFAQLYKRSFTYQEITHLLSYDSPSTAIRDYIWGFSYLKFENNQISYRKNYWFKLIKWLNAAVFMASAIGSLICFLMFIAGLIVSLEAQLLFNLAFLTVILLFIAWYTLNESRDVFAAIRTIEKQPSSNKNLNGKTA